MHIVQCGYPRSGSTMLYNMLRATVAGYEFFERETPAEWVINPANKITKDPKDVFNAPKLIERLGDQVKFLVTVRDPRSVLCSKHVNTGDLYKVSWDFTWKRGPKQMVRRDSNKHMGLIDWHKAIRAFVPNIIVRYEDLILATETQQQRIGEALGLTFIGSFLDFYERDIPNLLTHQMNGVRPVETSRINAWHDHPERIKQQFTECPELFDLVMELGYEKDNSWFQQL